MSKLKSKKTTIVVSKETVKVLRGLKIIPRESIEQVILRLIGGDEK